MVWIRIEAGPQLPIGTSDKSLICIFRIYDSDSSYSFPQISSPLPLPSSKRMAQVDEKKAKDIVVSIWLCVCFS